MLETGEFIRVGSSKVIKTNVRVVAASNIDIPVAISNGKFRQDLYYRLNTVPIMVPPLRDRKEDIYLLFRKFASDSAEKYHMPPIHLEEKAQRILLEYRWPGNIRQLKNLTEQISILEPERIVTIETLVKYLPNATATELPVLYQGEMTNKISERELLYKVLFDMKRDMNDLKDLVMNLINTENAESVLQESSHLINRLYEQPENKPSVPAPMIIQPASKDNHDPMEEHVEVEESLSLVKKEMDFIRKALERHDGKRKDAARELGISERTLYRKIKEYNLE